MGKPNKVVEKKRGVPGKADFQRRKKSFYKYKKILQKEGISNPSLKNSGEKKQKVLHSEETPKGRKRSAGSTNSLLQTYEKVKSKKEIKEEAAKKRQEQIKKRQDKVKTKRMRHIKLSKLTKKGQPVMKNKMELMLEKIVKDQETYTV